MRVWSRAGWLGLALFLSAVPGLADEMPKAERPSAERQKEVAAVIEETYDISKAKNQVTRQPLIKKLVGVAENPATPSDELFVLLQLIRKMSLQNGDWTNFKFSNALLAETFQPDPAAPAQSSTIEFLSATNSMATYRITFRDMIAEVRRDLASDEFEQASSVLAAAASTGKRLTVTKDYRDVLTEMATAIADRKVAKAANETARTTLEQKPDDPQASLNAGLWAGLYEEDWDAARPLLAKSSDAALKKAAEAELADDGGEDADQAIGDAWFEVSQKQKGLLRHYALTRAAEKYADAVSKIESPLVKGRINKRISEIKIASQANDLVYGALPVPKGVAGRQKRQGGADISHQPESGIPIGEWVELMPHLKVKDMTIQGRWSLRDNQIVGEVGANSTLMFPLVVSGGFEAELEFVRESGVDFIAFLFPVGASDVAILLGGWNGTCSGLNLVDGRDTQQFDPSSGVSYRPGTIINLKPHRLRCDVTLNGEDAAIEATLDDIRIVQWSGKESQLGRFNSFLLPVKNALAISSNANKTDVTRIAVRLKPGSRGYLLEDDWKNPINVVDRDAPSEVRESCQMHDGRPYYISPAPMDFPAAQELATKLRGRLVTVSSAEEEKFLYDIGRSQVLWTAGWKWNEGKDWFDERHRPLQYIGAWGKGQPQGTTTDTNIMICTTTNPDERGWHDVHSWYPTPHACIEWGEEEAEK